MQFAALLAILCLVGLAAARAQPTFTVQRGRARRREGGVRHGGKPQRGAGAQPHRRHGRQPRGAAGRRGHAGQVVAVVGDEKLVAADQVARRADRRAASAARPGADRSAPRRDTVPPGRRSAQPRWIRRAPPSMSPPLRCARAPPNARWSQQNMQEGKVLAPAAGRVLTVPVTTGTVMLTGETVATIGEQNFVLRLRVPERHARFLKAGDPVRIGGEQLGTRAARIGNHHAGLSADRGRPRGGRRRGGRPRRLFRRRARAGLDLGRHARRHRRAGQTSS